MRVARSTMYFYSIAWVFLSFSNYQAEVSAQLSRSIDFNQRSQIEKQKSPDFSGEGRPGKRKGGGSRGGCPFINSNLPDNQKLPLTAIIPITHSGKTIAKHPTFLFYVPYSLQEAQSGEFLLREEVGRNGNNSIVKEIYRVSFTLPKTPGIVSFTLPTTKAPIEVNKWYRWEFKLNCAPPSPANDSVAGWVNRIEMTPELERQLKTAQGQEYDVYTNNRLWYDAIAQLAEEQHKNPSNPNLNDAWKKLLAAKGVNLEIVNEQRLVGNVLVQQ